MQVETFKLNFEDFFILFYFSEQPDSPSNILATEIGSRTISLRWTQPYDGNSPIVSFKIQHKLSSGKYIYVY